MNVKDKSLKLHARHKGKIATSVSVPMKSLEDLTVAYTPGVAEVSKAIANNKDKVFDYTIKGHTIAIVTDGSAVLGLGNVGPEAALPVMEGKAAIFKTFAGLDAFPICLSTQDSKEIIQTVRAITPAFGGIILEDIAAPRCFEIEESLQNLGIPVMHDDVHATAVVVLAGLINAVKLAKKKLSDIKVVVAGAGAAGTGVVNILVDKVKDVIVIDSKGIINKTRIDLDPYKIKLAKITNKNNLAGGLRDGLRGADVFVGVSKGGLLKPEYIKLMTYKPIIFALANPVPEIMPDEAKKAGAFIVATGRSDFPNQINNALALPGIFKAALQARKTKVTEEMKLKAARALAGFIKNPTPTKILPSIFDKGLVDTISKAVVDFG